MHSLPFSIAGIGGMLTQGESPREGATICLHGGPGAHCQTLYPFFPPERLSGAWYFADIPNHGRSEHTEGDWSPEACLARLDAFAQRLDGPLRVAGLSWGANVALEWAATYPERFSCLVSISGGGDLDAIIAHQSALIATMPPEVLALMAELEVSQGEAQRALSRQLWELTLPTWMATNPGLARYREGTRGFASDPAVAKAYTTTWLEPLLNPAHIQSLFERITVPSLLIRGLDDQMGDARCGMDVYIDDPSVDILLLGEAGHCPFVDQPERFFPPVKSFFDRVDALSSPASSASRSM